MKPLNEKIEIAIYNQGRELGAYLLEEEEYLTLLIDGFITLLNLELHSNTKLSNGEILGFKSKNSRLPAYSDIQVSTFNHNLLLKSKVDFSKWIKFDFSKNTVSSYTKILELKSIDKFIIEPQNHKIRVDVLLNSGKKVNLLKHKSTEINVIRDKQLLKTALENQQELKGIEIEIIEKA